ncbi:hypothetical protein T484DRAFT_1926888 [Baffinella frigidus]|nr:hypothetical protein T484DRAFT_1926888 [Cryptophyta sp. CCMP2293]
MGGLSVERARANANAPVVTKATRRPRSSSAPRKRSRSPGPRKKSPGPARGFPEGAGGKTDEEGAGEWGFSLHGIEDVPSQLAFNKFVLKGYRMKLTPAQCLWSMFRLHNETINIWSHTLPILYFVWIFMTDGVWQEAPFSFAIAVLPACLCMLCSNLYHIFMPLNDPETYRRLLFVDYLSVFNVMIWPEVLVIEWSFRCDEATMNRALGTAFYVGVEVAGLAGGVLNGTRMPEKLRPGNFDYFFNSHQLMHILTAVCVFCVYHGGEADYKFWHVERHQCPTAA